MIQDRIVELRRIPAGELLENPKNWRKHPKAQRDAMSSILKEIGYADALLARETDEGLMLIDGHLRKETTPDQEVPVLIVDLDDNEADLLLASHDPIAAMAHADSDALEAILKSTETTEEGVDKFLSRLANSHSILLGEAAEEDGPLPTPEEAITQPGDLWQLGDHRLLCGDATNQADVQTLLAGAVPHLMVTDPPYGVEYDPEWRAELFDQEVSAGKVTNDDRADWTEAWRLFPGAVAYVWHADKHTATTYSSLETAGFQPRSTIVWVKQTAPISRAAYHWRHELAWYAVKKGGTADWRGGRKQNTVWEIANANAYGGDQEDQNTIHSTQKPVECMGRPMRNHRTDAVYDPFLGSGTSIIAAHQAGISCYGLEIEPRYCDIIVQRWQNYSGQRADLARLRSSKEEKTTDEAPNTQRI